MLWRTLIEIAQFNSHSHSLEIDALNCFKCLICLIDFACIFSIFQEIFDYIFYIVLEPLPDLHGMATFTRTRPFENKSRRKLPVMLNLQTLRAKLETANSELLKAERRKISYLEVNTFLDL